ncbi:MAG: hypothetical protein F6K23_08470 [Okeania sp. SIO2C9]|uniref:hypothetical protein n=1 Tax=Okeania sp. SIO2C9 TaxID=2607791 RepID=UPI0013C1F708|nr:hypothetical protein [Okeania sp. SIO2C9]NEQ73109.1 hypothetical protein [Okeania sp. SIO2C9]
MAQRLKRWESPRYQGRNIKGRGGTARLRQVKKQQQQLRKNLKNQENGDKSSHFFLYIKL